jgi:hypothetical protein
MESRDCYPCVPHSATPHKSSQLFDAAPSSKVMASSTMKKNTQFSRSPVELRAFTPTAHHARILRNLPHLFIFQKDILQQLHRCRLVTLNQPFPSFTNTRAVATISSLRKNSILSAITFQACRDSSKQKEGQKHTTAGIR